uniref:GAG-pre-integrase domain-containing protein n=1 Tax=Lactuca sativa TaxID=4236 RepID=A0A9R1VY70_LACSA|nr:hypothetical protein LSAT_V11C400158640 [Lactuca sativa]
MRSIPSCLTEEKKVWANVVISLSQKKTNVVMSLNISTFVGNTDTTKQIGYPDWCPRNKKHDETKPKVAGIDTSLCPILGLTNKQYKSFLKHFIESGNTSNENKTPMSCVKAEKKAFTKTVDAWHKRLGHVSSDKLTHIDFLSNISFSKCLVNNNKMIKTQFGNSIRIRCDNGGEFTLNEMLKVYNKEEILLEATCPNTLQQNGVVDMEKISMGLESGFMSVIMWFVIVTMYSIPL